MLELENIEKRFNRGTPDESVLFQDFNFPSSHHLQYSQLQAP